MCNVHPGLKALKWLYKVAYVVELAEHNACLCQKEHLVLFIEHCTKSVKECQLPLEDFLEVIFPYLSYVGGLRLRSVTGEHSLSLWLCLAV